MSPTNAILSSFVAVLTFGCASAGTSPDFQIRDSGLRAAHNISVYWISNEEVLFAGPTGETRKRPDGSEEPINRVSTWNSRTSEVRRYGEIAAQLCYHDGYVVYWQRVSPQRLRVNYGKLGEESGVERGPLQTGEFYDAHTCRNQNELDALPVWAKQANARRLLPQHGFLVADGGSRNTTYSLCPTDANDRAQCVGLSIGQREVRTFNWHPFKGAYFAVGHYFQVDASHPDGGVGRSPWPKGVPMPVWWLYPDGRTERVMLPSGPWLNYFVSPTRNGFATVGHNNAGQQTLYFMAGDAVRPILVGLIEKDAVSPDGCRLAVIHDPKKPSDPTPQHQRHITLKVIDFCARGRYGIQHR
ncbi:MAG TPA: hypothetical protein VFB63_23320 [Bryobacteraceae bacterium]|nr:hypothetical protein [Bryobacteraceae bacterium]